MTAEQEKLIKLIATLVGEAALIGLLIHYGRKHLKGLFKALKAGAEAPKVKEEQKEHNSIYGDFMPAKRESKQRLERFMKQVTLFDISDLER